MPVVPRLSRQVGASALPDVKLTAAQTPESLGAKPDPIASALINAGHSAAVMGEEVYGRIVDEERKRADQVAVLNADTQLAAWENARLYDPDKGALTIKGRDALPLPETVGDEYNKKADEIDAGLTTPAQKMAFRRIRAERGINVDATLRKHTFAEMQQYQAGELQSSLENSRSAAISNSSDPKRVSAELQRQVDAIATHAKQLGFGPEEIQKQKDATTSATLVGVIETELAQGHQKVAQTYFDETKGQIKGESLARLEKALKEGGVRQEGQKQSDAIIAAGGTLSQQLDKAKAIADPEVRDRATEYIEHHAAVQDKIKRDDLEAASTTAFNMLDKSNGNLRTIPPTTWESFPGNVKASLRAYAEKLASGETIDTDWKTFYGLVDKAGTDPNSFATENMLAYRGKLANAEFKQLADLQLSIRNRDSKAREPLAEFGTEGQIVNDSLQQYGFETEPSKQSKDEKDAIAELRRRVREQVGLLKKKDITQKDIQSIVDGILSQKTTVKGSWWGILPGRNFFDQSKRLIDMKISDVPQADKDQITAALNAKGRPVSDTTILDLYIRAQGLAK